MTLNVDGKSEATVHADLTYEVWACCLNLTPNFLVLRIYIICNGIAEVSWRATENEKAQALANRMSAMGLLASLTLLKGIEPPPAANLGRTDCAFVLAQRCRDGLGEGGREHSLDGIRAGASTNTRTLFVGSGSKRVVVHSVSFLCVFSLETTLLNSMQSSGRNRRSDGSCLIRPAHRWSPSAPGGPILMPQHRQERAKCAVRIFWWKC